MKQQRWWPKWVEKHKDCIQVAHVEPFSRPCAVISNNTMAPRQRSDSALGTTWLYLHFGDQSVRSHNSGKGWEPPFSLLHTESCLRAFWGSSGRGRMAGPGEGPPQGGAVWQEKLDPSRTFAMTRQNITMKPSQILCKSSSQQLQGADWQHPNLPQMWYQTRTSHCCWRSK